MAKRRWITSDRIKQAATIMSKIEWRTSGLAQYCVRSIMEQMGVSENLACKLCGAAITQGVVKQDKGVRVEHMDRKEWGATYGKVPQVYFRWILCDEENNNEL